jgi:H+/Cl- antiporter ClcA
MTSLLSEEANDVRQRHHQEQQVYREQQLWQRKMLQWAGRPYLIRSGGFWLLSFTIKLSALMGIVSFVVLWSIHWVKGHLIQHPVLMSAETVTTNMSSFSSISPLQQHILVGSFLGLGGIISTILLWCLPFSTGKIRHLFHNLIDLDVTKITLRENCAMALSSWMVLLCGAPLGPELVLGAVDTILVSLISDRPFIPGSSDARTKACWTQATLAGALAPIFPTPLSSALAIQELVLSTRPHNVTIDAALEKRSRQQRHTTAGWDESEDDASVALDSQEEDMETPLLTRLPAANHAGNLHFLERPSSLDHDIMEGFFLSGISAIVSFLVYQTLCQFFDVELYPWQTYQNIFDETTRNHTFEQRQYLLATALGFLGGLLGSLILLLTSICHWIRSRTSQWLRLKAMMPKLFGPVLFSLLTGLVIVGLSFLLPQPWMVFDDGFDLGLYLLRQHDNLPPTTLLLAIGAQTICLAISLGFGWVGGPLFPLASIGLGSGLLVSSLLKSLEISFTVPCCMAAVVGSIVPAPFAAAVTISHLFGLSVEQVGPVFVATVVAQIFTKGLGLMRCFGRRVVGLPSGYSSEDEEHEEHVQRQLAAPSEDEILQSIRSAIFGRTP